MKGGSEGGKEGTAHQTCCLDKLVFSQGEDLDAAFAWTEF